MKFANKMLLSVLGMVVFAAVFSGWLLYRNHARLLEQAMHSHHRELADHLLDHTGFLLAEARADLAMLAQEPDVVSLLERTETGMPATEILREAMAAKGKEGFPPWEGLLLADGEGRVLAGFGPPWPPRIKGAGRVFETSFRRALEGRDHHFDMLQQKGGEGERLLISLPIARASGSPPLPIGVLLGILDWQWMAGSLRERFGQHHFCLVDGTGRVLLEGGGEPAGCLADDTGFEDFLQHAKQEGGVYSRLYTSAAAQEVFAMYVPGKDFLRLWGEPLGLVLEIPLRHLGAPLRQMVLRTSLVIAFTLALVAVLLYHLTRRCTRPLSQLTMMTERVASGRLDGRVEVAGRDEFSQLADAFNAMVEQLENRDRELAEALAQTTEALATAEAAKRGRSEFLSMMSHEIRTPLNGLLGMAELLQGSGLNDRQHQFVRSMRQSGETLLSLIANLLDLSLVDGDALSVRCRSFSPTQLVGEMLGLFSERARAKGVVLQGRVDEDLPPVVRGDDLRLRQVLTNLLGNALRFTEKGRVELSLSSAGEQEGRVLTRFEVIDTGIGIPLEYQERIFETFFCSEKNDASRGGRGLGLAVCRKMVEGMGGTIEVESEPGHGALFRVTLGLERVEAEAGTSLGRELMGRRALIVGTPEEELEPLRQDLALWGVRAQGVPDLDTANQALALAEDGGAPFDLVLVEKVLADGAPRALAPGGTGRPLPPLTLLTSEGEVADGGLTLERPFAQEGIYRLLRRVFQPAEVSPWRRAGLGERALLVEDNPVNVEVARSMLEQLGWQVEVAVTGREALDAYRSRPCGLVLMDCQMPEMDGYETTRLIRAWERSRGVERPALIVAVTASVLHDDQERCRDAGMDDFLAKPFSFEELRRRVGRCTAAGGKENPSG